MQITQRFQALADEFAPSDNQTFGLFEVGVFIVACLGLTVMQFGGSEDVFLKWVWPLFSDTGPVSWRPNMPLEDGQEFYHLAALGHWSVFCFLGYVVLPWVYIRLNGWRVADAFGGVGRLGQHSRIYVFLFILVLIPVIGVSFTPEYQKIYPFYPQASRSLTDLVLWQCIYGLQFFSLEFFFRGYLLATLRPCFGIGALFVSVVPYCMLHFPKTGSESLAAIVAGLVLGVFAMRYRSIWGGALLHWAVAITMDVASLLQRGELPSTW